MTTTQRWFGAALLIAVFGAMLAYLVQLDPGALSRRGFWYGVLVSLASLASLALFRRWGRRDVH